MPNDPFQFIPQGNNKTSSIIDGIMKYILLNTEIPNVFWDIEKANHDVRPKVMWKAKGAEEICITEMSTRHLFFTLRLVYNSLIQHPAFQLDFDKTRILRFPTATEGKGILAGMFEEIGTRDNITEQQLADLTFMAKNTRIHL